ncbi:hypothetical protein A4H97_00135 [Niastella yeongjuensis]|uniref:Uncharacterized protein n=1 Tax=Niastella yeongjuensis TaxID=354355 RepID=A0A1V9EVV7_9BACT|nr:hypothetical protein [Niastella yeongjuensis]OQP50293.1 hypothetical protein A4H97_00135 [Niastella yeongjuensis]SEN40854.1 hypothetical protein SAMN05660816_00924 [Niastella yeongjuensis]
MHSVFRIKKVIQRLAIVAASSMTLTGCYKYKELEQVPNAAYLRVFNSIPFTVDALHAGQAAPFLCFLVDPVTDADGIPNGGAISGDWLQTRNAFSLSYAADAATALNAQQKQSQINAGLPTEDVVNANYEYPGKLHVLTAPAMNGMDLSAWAQIPSGKHRFVFVARPQDNRPFGELPGTLRKNMIIDTTIDLEPGEVYTMSALATDIDKNQYGVNVRQEQFVHENFDPGRVYATFYNLSSVRPYLASDPHFPSYWNFADTLVVSYTCWVNDDNLSNNVASPQWPLNGSNNVYMTTLYRGKSDGVFTSLPFLTRENFFDQQGVLRTWTFLKPGSATKSGTLPYISFKFTDPSPLRSKYGNYPLLLCSADPAVYNTLENLNISTGSPLQGPNPSLIYQPNLFGVVQSGGSVNIYPTVNIFEIINDKVYLMQLQRNFEKVPQ